jgi:hypothetical protein
MSTSDDFELLFLIGGSAIIFMAWLGMAVSATLDSDSRY